MGTHQDSAGNNIGHNGEKRKSEALSIEASYHRHDITDEAWGLIEPHAIGNKRTWGGNARDALQFLNAVFWILCTGPPWRNLPPDYGNWNTVQRRFRRWRDRGIWEELLEAVIRLRWWLDTASGSENLGTIRIPISVIEYPRSRSVFGGRSL